MPLDLSIGPLAVIHHPRDMDTGKGKTTETLPFRVLVPLFVRRVWVDERHQRERSFTVTVEVIERHLLNRDGVTHLRTKEPTGNKHPEVRLKERSRRSKHKGHPKTKIHAFLTRIKTMKNNNPATSPLRPRLRGKRHPTPGILWETDTTRRSGPRDWSCDRIVESL